MKIHIVGTGAIGGMAGWHMANSGENVTFVDRWPEHVQAIARDGLRLEAHGRDEHIALEASTEANAVRGAKLVLFCVKSTDTEPAAAHMKSHLEPDTLLLTLQNGVDNAERLRRVLPQPVAAAVVYVATEMAGAGHVRHHGRGELVIEPSVGSLAAQRMLIAAGVPTEISNNVRGALWAKLILNCAYNALSAISRRPYGPLVQGEGVPDVMRDVVAECLAVAAADGVQVVGDVPAAVARIAQTMPSQYSSTAQDLMRGKKSEIDHLNGYVMRRGEALGIATPANRVLHTLVKLLEG